MPRTATLQLQSWQQLADHFPGIQPIANLEKSGAIEFRSYQALAVSSVLFSGYRGVVRSATGSGKTLIGAAICASMFPRTSVVLVHGKALVQQTYDRFVEYLGKDNVGFATPDGFEPGPVTVASIDSIAFYMGTVPLKKDTRVPIMDPKVFEQKQKVFVDFLANKVDMLVFDECHHGSADTWQDIGDHTDALYRVGLSGTPLKFDQLADMLMLSLVGPVVYDLNASWLQKNNFLAKARLEIRTLDYTSAKSRKYDYHEARKELLVSNQHRHVSIANDIVKALQDPNTTMLVMTGNSVEMAESIAEEVDALTGDLQRRLGYAPFALATGKMTSKKVVRAFDQLRRGDIQCVITTKIADEGLDVPNINTILLVGGGKAFVATVQRIGRGLRVKDGEELLVVDYFTKGSKILATHDRQRLRTYEGENFFYEVTYV